MYTMLRRMREERAEGDSADKGFTLIELLVVVVIIGILVAIAIPLYSNYKKGAENKSAESDVRNAVAVVEQCYADNNVYPPDAVTATKTKAAVCPGRDMNAGSNNTITYTWDGTNSKYTIIGSSDNGDKQFTYDSSTGKIASAAKP